MLYRLVGVLFVLSLTACGTASNTTIVSRQELPMTVPSPPSYTFISQGVHSESGFQYSVHNIVDTSQDPDESMRVLINRQSSSHTWLIHLHGGPGSVIRPTALYFLYNNYNVVYFQQRGSGSSSGPDYCDSNNNCVNSYTMLSAMFSDLEFLIDTIKSTDSQAKIVLFGESWGVYYGLLYMAVKEDADVTAMVFDSGSAFDIDLNFLGSANEIKDYDWEAVPTINSLTSEERTSLRNDFTVLQTGVNSALSSSESSLDSSAGNDFINFYNTLNDYIMNAEYMVAAKAKLQPPFTSSGLTSYPGPMDWDATLSAGGTFVGIGSVDPSSYFAYSTRFSYWQNHASVFVAALSNVSRGTSTVISPLLFDINGLQPSDTILT